MLHFLIYLFVCFSFSKLVVCFGCKLLSSLHLSFLSRWTEAVPCTPPRDSWDRDLTLPLSAMHAESGSPEDDAVFLLAPTGPELSPTFSHRWRIIVSIGCFWHPCLLLSVSIFLLNLFTFLLFHRIKSRLSMESTSTPLPRSPTHNRQSPASTPTSSILDDWHSYDLAQTPSSIHSNGSCHTLTPNASPIHAHHHTGDMKENSSCHASSCKSSQRRDRNWVLTEEVLPRPNFEPKNLLSLFEETTLEG